jgi:hypothetical protein
VHIPQTDSQLLDPVSEMAPLSIGDFGSGVVDPVGRDLQCLSSVIAFRSTLTRTRRLPNDRSVAPSAPGA